MIENILYILSMASLIYGIYFIITGLLAFIKMRKQVVRVYAPSRKLGVIIPCRNEEKVIGNLVESLKKQKYPKELYEIFVAPNNCSDKTEEVAKNKGATIIQCDIPIKSKGDVLKYSFSKLQDREFDAYVIFDADNVVHPNFLSRMNDALCAGYKVAQGYRDSKNPSDSWLSGSYSIFYWVQNFFFNKSRMRMNGSASLNGTGFMVEKSVIDQYGFNTATMTEDIEFTAQCAINDIKIVFVENAITYDEQPITWNASWKQRKRWSTGTYQCCSGYSKSLLNGFIKNKNIACLDMFLIFLAPYIQLFSTAVMIALITHNIFILPNITLQNLLRITGVYMCILSYLVNVFCNIFIVKYNKKKIKSVISGIFLFAFFMITWIPINIVSLFNKTNNWEPIKHDRNVAVSDLIKE